MYRGAYNRAGAGAAAARRESTSSRRRTGGLERYQRIRPIGKGSFGSIYLVRRKTAPAGEFALKQISMSQMTPSAKRETMREIDILKSVTHPNILHFDESFVSNASLCIITEFCGGGDLHAKIKKQRGRYFPEDRILSWFTQICLALRHLHDRNILHRDLKTLNIFLTNDDEVRLGDFGIARLLGTGDLASTKVGTPVMVPPELVKDQPYGSPADVWALGCVLHEMCTLKPTFMANDLDALFKKIMRATYPPIPAQYSHGVRRLISKMITVNPRNRPSVADILDDPLLLPYVARHATREFDRTLVAPAERVDFAGEGGAAAEEELVDEEEDDAGGADDLYDERAGAHAYRGRAPRHGGADAEEPHFHYPQFAKPQAQRESRAGRAHAALPRLHNLEAAASPGGANPFVADVLRNKGIVAREQESSRVHNDKRPARFLRKDERQLTRKPSEMLPAVRSAAHDAAVVKPGRIGGRYRNDEHYRRQQELEADRQRQYGARNGRAAYIPDDRVRMLDDRGSVQANNGRSRAVSNAHQERQRQEAARREEEARAAAEAERERRAAAAEEARRRREEEDELQRREAEQRQRRQAAPSARVAYRNPHSARNSAYENPHARRYDERLGAPRAAALPGIAARGSGPAQREFEVEYGRRAPAAYAAPAPRRLEPALSRPAADSRPQAQLLADAAREQYVAMREAAMRNRQRSQANHSFF